MKFLWGTYWRHHICTHQDLIFRIVQHHQVQTPHYKKRRVNKGLRLQVLRTVRMRRQNNYLLKKVTKKYWKFITSTKRKTLSQKTFPNLPYNN